VVDPMESVWRAQREAAARFTEGWRGLLTGPAGAPVDAATAAPAGPSVEERFQALTRSLTDYAETVAQPLHDLVDSQRDFVDQMARWAELQRELADNVASWAARQRQHVDHLDRLLAPFSPRSTEPNP